MKKIKIVTEEEIRERLKEKGYSNSQIDALINRWKELDKDIKAGKP